MQRRCPLFLLRRDLLGQLVQVLFLRAVTRDTRYEATRTAHFDSNSLVPYNKSSQHAKSNQVGIRIID